MNINLKKKIKKKLLITEILFILILFPLSVFVAMKLSNIFMPKFVFDFANIFKKDNFMFLLLSFTSLVLPFAISFTFYDFLEYIIIKPYLNGMESKDFLNLLEEKEDIKNPNITNIKVSQEKDEYINGIKILKIKELNPKELKIKECIPRVLTPRPLNKEEIVELYKRYPYLKRYIEN